MAHRNKTSRKVRTPEDIKALCEDLAFMAEHGETIDGAARRLETTQRTLEVFGRDHCPGVLFKLFANKPILNETCTHVLMDKVKVY